MAHAGQGAGGYFRGTSHTSTHRMAAISTNNGGKSFSEPSPARVVLATEDLKLLKDAVLYYLKEVQGTPELTKFSNLYDRLSSATGR